MSDFKKSDKLAGLGDAAPKGPVDLGIELFNGDILVLRDPAPDTAGETGRIQLPDSAKRDPHIGAVVLTAAEGKGGGPPKFAVGDRVRFPSFAGGQAVEIGGVTYLRMSEGLIWAREKVSLA